MVSGRWRRHRALRSEERAILAAIRDRADPDLVLDRLRALQEERGRAGRSERFLAFWQECRALMGDTVISRHGYQASLASQDRSRLFAEVEELIAAIRSHGPQACVISGSLLGLVRDGGPIEYDDDVDLAVILPGRDLSPAARAAQWADLRAELRRAGLIDAEYESLWRLHARGFTSAGVAVDLFPGWIDRDRAFVFPHTFGTLPARALLPLSDALALPAPADPTGFLESNYGPDWAVPDPLWTFDWKAARARFGGVVKAWGGLRAAHAPSPAHPATDQAHPDPALPLSATASAPAAPAAPAAGRRLVLHCGALKTGTTAVQHLLWHRREELLDAGVLYPLAGLVTDEPEAGVRHNRLIYAWQQDREEFDRTLTELAAEITASGAGTVVLSAESWCRPQFRPSLEALVAHLRATAEITSVQSVLVLRNRQEHARSLYREYTARRRNDLVCTAFLASERGWFDPLASVEHLAAIGDEVTVLPYDGRASVAEALAALGVPSALATPSVPAPPSAGAPVDAGASRGGGAPYQHNVSLDAIEIEARRVVNRIALEAREHWPGLDSAVVARLRDQVEARPTEILDPAPYRVDAAWRRRFRDLTGWSKEDVARLQAWTPETGVDIAALAPLIAAEVHDWARAELVETRVVAHTHPVGTPGVRLRRVEATLDPESAQVTGIAAGIAPEATLWVDIAGTATRIATEELPAAANAVRMRRRRFTLTLPAAVTEAAVWAEQDGVREPIGELRQAWRPPAD